MFLALGSLDCKCAKYLVDRRNVERSGADYNSIDDIAEDSLRGGRQQPPAPYAFCLSWLQPGRHEAA